MVLENNKANLAKYMVAEKTATQNTSVERRLSLSCLLSGIQ